MPGAKKRGALGQRSFLGGMRGGSYLPVSGYSNPRDSYVSIFKTGFSANLQRPNGLCAGRRPFYAVALRWAGLLGVGLALCGSTAAPARQGPFSKPGSFPEPVASYTLTAELDPDSHRVRGSGTLTWRNTSRSPVGELYFHLYLNAFRNTSSTYLRHADEEKIKALRRGGWGWIEVDELTWVDDTDGAGDRAADGTRLTGGLECVAPDDGNPEDCTLVRVALPLPIAPGRRVELRLAFLSQLPRVVDRTGFKDDFHLVAQWFPKIARLEPDGRWHAHQFHPHSEFHADYGTYDVTLTVPRGYRVGATGSSVDDREHGRDPDLRVHRYVQQGVHDFAWTAWPGFVERRSTFSHEGLPEVDLILLLRPETVAFADRYLDALRNALRLFGSWYGPYPYRTLTMVDPPWGAEDAGAMEYPTFITTGTRVLNPPATHDPEALTVHELGHQFWYGLVATDEFREAFLDEGLNSYSTARVMREAYRPRAWSFRLWGWDLAFPGVRLRDPVDTAAGYFRTPSSDPVSRTSWGFLDDDAYWNLAYDKTALLLEQLERTLGAEVMERALHAYATRYRFRHPRTEDFVRTLSAESGRDLAPYFEQTLHGSNILDYAVTEVETAPREGPIGIFGQGQERVRFNTPETLPGWDGTVVVRRLGGVRLPVTVELVFEGGGGDDATDGAAGLRRVRRTWDGEERWIRYRTEGPRLLWAEVDPDHLQVLDIDRLNNSRRVEPDRRASRAWSERVGFWIQNLLEIFATFS